MVVASTLVMLITSAKQLAASEILVKIFGCIDPPAAVRLLIYETIVRRRLASHQTSNNRFQGEGKPAGQVLPLGDQRIESALAFSMYCETRPLASQSRVDVRWMDGHGKLRSSCIVLPSATKIFERGIQFAPGIMPNEGELADLA